MSQRTHAAFYDIIFGAHLEALAAGTADAADQRSTAKATIMYPVEIIPRMHSPTIILLKNPIFWRFQILTAENNASTCTSS